MQRLFSVKRKLDEVATGIISNLLVWVMPVLATYVAWAQQWALPFIILVGLGAIGLGLFAANQASTFFQRTLVHRTPEELGEILTKWAIDLPFAYEKLSAGENFYFRFLLSKKATPGLESKLVIGISRHAPKLLIMAVSFRLDNASVDVFERLKPAEIFELGSELVIELAHFGIDFALEPSPFTVKIQDEIEIEGLTKFIFKERIVKMMHGLAIMYKVIDRSVFRAIGASEPISLQVADTEGTPP